jgi:hypothetical protein
MFVVHNCACNMRSRELLLLLWYIMFLLTICYMSALISLLYLSVTCNVKISTRRNIM